MKSALFKLLVVVSLLGLAVTGGAAAAPADADVSVQQIDSPTLTDLNDDVTTDGACYYHGTGQFINVECE